MQISKHYCVPDDILGYLEWTSGFLYINAGFEEFQTAMHLEDRTALTEKQRQLFQTISHETYHFTQIITTGWGMRFACEAFSTLREVLPPIDSQEDIDRVLTDGLRMPDGYRHLLRQLDDKNPVGVSVRSIVESSTLLFEHQTHYPNLDHLSYKDFALQHYRESSEYRFAYDYVAEALGEHAFSCVLGLAFVSLCFDDPKYAYCVATEFLRRDGIPAQWDLPTIQELAHAVAKHCKPLGSAPEFSDGGDRHPVYWHAMAYLNEHADKRSPVLCMIHPELGTIDWAKSIVRPILFKNGVCYIPNEFTKRSDRFDDSQMLLLSLIGAFAMKIGQQSEPLSNYHRIKIG